MTDYDVIINGAGMVGAVTALMLAEQDLHVAVIESQAQTHYSSGEPRQMRVSAISKHNLVLLERLGLGLHWHEHRIGYYNHMQVWDNHSTGEIQFSSSGKQVLGAMIENAQVMASAQHLVSKHKNIDVFYETAIETFEDKTRKVQLKLNNGNQISAYLLIGADGARSQIREQLGIKFEQQSYEQKGLVCYLKIEKAPENTALQAFNSGGPVGLLPMNDGVFSMVWSLPEDQVDHWLDADEQLFINGLKAHINRDFGDMSLISQRAAFPLNKSCAKTFYQGRVVLIGDAAHTIHPLAGQGVNLGFGDAKRLVEKLNLDDSLRSSLKNIEDLSQTLKKYQRVRMAEVRKTSATMHALHHLFANQTAAVKAIRAFGMNRLNQLKPIKQWLLGQAGS